MIRKTFIQTVLAATIGASLAGCSGLPTGVLDGLGANLSSTQRLAVQSMVADAVSTMQAEMDMDASGTLIQDPTFRSTQHLEVAAKASASAEARIGYEKRENRFKEKGKKHIDEIKAGARNVVKTEVDNGDGTKTATITVEINHKNRVMKQVVERTYQTADNTVINAKFHMEAQQKNGLTVVRDRERTLQADGSYAVSFKSTFTRKDGKVRTIEWNTVEAVDGTVTGSGIITRFDGSTVTVTIVRNADGTTTTTTVDSKVKVEAEITQPEGSTQAEVDVEADGQAAGSTTVTNTTEVEASAQ